MENNQLLFPNPAVSSLATSSIPSQSEDQEDASYQQDLAVATDRILQITAPDMNPDGSHEVGQSKLLIQEGDQQVEVTAQQFSADVKKQSEQIQHLGLAVSGIRNSTSSILNRLDPLRDQFAGSLQEFQTKLTVLKRMQETCHLMRSTNRVMELGRHLSNPESVDPATTASYIHEIQSIVNQNKDQISRIEAIQPYLQRMSSERDKILQSGIESLMMGLKSCNASQIESALLIFHYTGSLEDMIKRIRSSYTDDIQAQLKQVLFPESPQSDGVSSANPSGPGKLPSLMVHTPAHMVNFKANLWSGISKLFDACSEHLNKLGVLFYVLKQTKDPIAKKKVLLDSISEPADGQTEYWNVFMADLESQLVKSTKESSHLRETLEGEYPALLQKVNHFTGVLSSKDHTKCLNPKSHLSQILGRYESAYLSRSLSRLFDSVNVIFADAKETANRSFLIKEQPSQRLSPENKIPVPSQQDINSLVKTVSDELSIVSWDALLAGLVAKNVSKTIKLFSQRAEQLISVDGNATQVIGPPTGSQKLNATICHRLEALAVQLKRLIESSTSLPRDTASVLEASITALYELQGSCLNPLSNSIQDAIEAIILTIHQEDFSKCKAPRPGQTSLYMRELQSFLARVVSDYFKLYPASQVTQRSMHQVAARCIDLFLRHTTLIRPLSEHGKMRLCSDFAQLELGLEPLFQSTSEKDDGIRPYKALRSFKSVILFEDDVTSLVQNPLVGDLISYSVLIHWLISNKGPRALKLPHEHMSWSVSRYNTWLDSHQAEHERLKLICNSLESYSKLVQQQATREYDPIYPVLYELLERGLHASS